MWDRVRRWWSELVHPPAIDSPVLWRWYWSRCVPAQVTSMGLLVGVPFETWIPVVSIF